MCVPLAKFDLPNFDFYNSLTPKINLTLAFFNKVKYYFLMRFLGSHVIHFLVMGLGISLVVGMLKPTLRPERTIRTVRNHALGLVGIGLLLAWIMYLLPWSPVRF